MRKGKTIFLAVIALSFLVVGFTGSSLRAQNEQSGGAKQEPTPAAYVNGEPLETTVSQLRNSARRKVFGAIRSLTQSNPDFASFLFSSQQLRGTLTEKYARHRLDQKIMEEIQRRKANSLGIEVTDKQVEEEMQKRVEQQIQKIIAQNRQLNSVEDVKKALNKQNKTLEEFKKRIRSSMGGPSQVRSSLLQEKLKMEVLEPVQEPTEQEIKSYYQKNKDSYKDDKGNVKPLEEVRSDIKKKLQRQAQRERHNRWQDWLKQAKKEASIEKNL